MIEAAGDDRAVGEDAEVIAKTVAEKLSGAFLGIGVWPIEAFTVFEVETVAKPCTALTFNPFFGEFFLQSCNGAVVSAAVVSEVPKAKDGEDT